MGFIIVIFGVLGLLIIFGFWGIIMAGVAEGNSSALASNYGGFNETINAIPWLIPVAFVFIIAMGWWWNHTKK